MDGKYQFISEREQEGFEDFLARWSHDTARVKEAFQRIALALASNEPTVFYFHPRPGVSYSPRASLEKAKERARPYYAVIDIVEEFEAEPWLSVCFYADTVSDPEDLGNLIPNGLLEEDGYCFDVDCYDERLLRYIEARIKEAYQAHVSGLKPST